MLTLLSLVVDIVLKALKIGAKIALNRATFIIAFVGGIAYTLSNIFQNLEDVGSVLSDAVGNIQSVSSTISSFVGGNDYLSMLAYALSLDTLADGVIGSFFWLFVTVSGFVLSALSVAVVAVLPLFAEMAVSAIKDQFAKSMT